jgi:hypothetical protein
MKIKLTDVEPAYETICKMRLDVIKQEADREDAYRTLRLRSLVETAQLMLICVLMYLAVIHIW